MNKRLNSNENEKLEHKKLKMNYNYYMKSLKIQIFKKKFELQRH